MSQREMNILWLRDILGHLVASQKQLEWAEEPATIRLLTENMLRDLGRCQRLCEALRCRRELAAAS